MSKCTIDSTKCMLCGTCKENCIQNAIEKDKFSYIINENKCIGCNQCFNNCTNHAIEKYSKEISFAEILPSLIEEGIDCMEYHISTDNDEDVKNGWKIITNNYKGAVSVCLDRSKIGDEQIKNRLIYLKKNAPSLFIVQADGAPMSGGNDDYRTTLQAVAMADIVDKLNITQHILVSGGTNSKTTELLHKCGINISGIAVGSYARKIVKKYIENDQFFENKTIFNKALNIARLLVNNV